jgi:hypothetical protein
VAFPPQSTEIGLSRGKPVPEKKIHIPTLPALARLGLREPPVSAKRRAQYVLDGNVQLTLSQARKKAAKEAAKAAAKTSASAA